MISTKQEYEAALKKLAQNDESLSKQRMELVKSELSIEDIELCMSPLINFRNMLKTEITNFQGGN